MCKLNHVYTLCGSASLLKMIRGRFDGFYNENVNEYYIP